MYNTVIGSYAGGEGNTSANHGNYTHLIYIGHQAGRLAINNGERIGIGACASYCDCGSWGRVNIGYQANTCGRSNYYNTSVGLRADYCGWWTYRSTAVGWNAAAAGGYHCDFVGIGFEANFWSYVARYTVSIGSQANLCGQYGYYNVSIGAGTAYHGGRSGWNTYCNNTNIGYEAGTFANNSNMWCNGRCNTFIGAGARAYSSGGTYNDNQLVIGFVAQSNGNHTTTIGTSNTTNTYLCGAVTKSSGSFRIIHPNPKMKNKWLFHSFVESPTAGDNIYRWSVDVCGCSCSIKLPDYYKYLNENDMAWVKPVDHFGSAYAEVDKEQDNLTICSNKDGCYNVILIGTRCDEQGAKSWTGTERDMKKSEIDQYADKYANVVQ
jgi:hypothetical protein